jgi:hypothetical protein
LNGAAPRADLMAVVPRLRATTKRGTDWRRMKARSYLPSVEEVFDFVVDERNEAGCSRASCRTIGTGADSARVALNPGPTAHGSLAPL